MFSDKKGKFLRISFISGPLNNHKKNNTVIKLLLDEVGLIMLGASIDSVS